MHAPPRKNFEIGFPQIVSEAILGLKQTLWKCYSDLHNLGPG